MARCKVCQHPDRDKIDGKLAANESVRDTAKAFGLSRSSVHRHRVACIPAMLAKAREAREATDAESGDTLLERVAQLETKANRLLDKAEANADHRTAVAAVRELRGVLELFGKVAGQLRGDGANVAVQVNVQANGGTPAPSAATPDRAGLEHEVALGLDVLAGIAGPDVARALALRWLDRCSPTPAALPRPPEGPTP